jgi:chromosome partitioning protein
MARTIAICNQKGGVGKTTTAVNLGAALAARDNSVLLIDLDPRGDLSQYIGINTAQADHTVYHALFDDDISLRDVIFQTPVQGVSAAPADIDLSGAEIILMQEDAEDRHAFVRRCIDEVDDTYDYILLDSPPGLQMLTISSLVAADEVLVPQQTSFMALHGLRQLHQSIERVQEGLNPDLALSGILMTMQDRRTIHNQQVIDMVREGFGDVVFEAVIPATVRVQEAAAAGQPITEYDATNPAATAYDALAEEVIDRGTQA